MNAFPLRQAARLKFLSHCTFFTHVYGFAIPRNRIVCHFGSSQIKNFSRLATLKSFECIAKLSLIYFIVYRILPLKISIHLVFLQVILQTEGKLLQTKTPVSIKASTMNVIRTSGIRGLYNGLSASILRQVNKPCELP